MASIALAKRTFMLFSGGGPPIGTGFGIARPGLVLTADHVIRSVDPKSLTVVCTYYKELVRCRVERIERHPEADVAALFISKVSNTTSLEFFELGIPSDVYEGYSDYPLAEDVLAFGFAMLGSEKPVPPRMMKGHIQARYEYSDTKNGYRYHAYELAFPAFPNLSGSPVFADMHNREAALAIVTVRASYSTEMGGHETRAYWAIGAALHPLADWLESL